VNRAGYITTNGEGESVFYVLPEVYRSELAKGFELKLFTRVCIAAGYLAPSKESPSTSVTTPDERKTRVYVFRNSVLEE
jgi:uncharacterized protein (DUF927 family)